MIVPALLLLPFIWISAAHAEGDSTGVDDGTIMTPHMVWVNAGFGVGDLEGEGAPSAGGAVTMTLSQGSMISLRAIYLEEFQICVFGPCAPADYLYDVGALYGIMHKEKWWYAGGSIGAGLTGGRISSGSEQNSFTTGALLVGGEIFFTPFSFAGIGLQGYANANPKQSFLGALLCLQFGRLR
jgi:hypothetical protein